MLHVPILRGGEPYRSLNAVELRDVRSGEPVARVSQANAGLVARDLNRAAEHRRALSRLTVDELLAICRKAAQLFTEASLPVDPLDGQMQTPDDFVAFQSATTGMPRAMCRANMEKIRFVLAETETVLAGLTRGLDLRVLDDGWGLQDRRVLSYVAQADVLGAILPSNSPGVHSLWLPAIPLKVPLALKPGRQEPWTPMRILQALRQAGCPGGALGYYPSDHGAASEILLRCGRSMLFGDVSTVRGWAHDPRVQIHGPGWSKVLLGPDRADDWERDLDVMVHSVADNGGRSCLNASGVWVPKHGRAVAEALARKLAEIEPRPLDDPRAAIAAFSDPTVAHRISEFIDRQLDQPGAEDVSESVRGGGRVVEIDGCTFLRPTVIWCSDPGHPLAQSEFLFPFAAVVENDPGSTPQAIGPTLVATVLGQDREFRESVMASRHVDRLNLGDIPTSRVSWDQPHEGNLFEHLYRQRAFQARNVDPAA